MRPFRLWHAFIRIVAILKLSHFPMTVARIRPMTDRRTPGKRAKRPPKPLDSRRLQDLALSYVARFSTSAAKLEAYLARKLRERGWDGEGAPDIPALVGRYVELGYIDDEAYARSRAGSLLRRGYGARRVGQALYAAGIDETIRAAVDPQEYARREAASVMARKRRFGPYYTGELERDRREKQVAAMLRAGHTFDHARFVIDAASEQAIEEWLAEARDTIE